MEIRIVLKDWFQASVGHQSQKIVLATPRNGLFDTICQMRNFQVHALSFGAKSNRREKTIEKQHFRKRTRQFFLRQSDPSMLTTGLDGSLERKSNVLRKAKNRATPKQVRHLIERQYQEHNSIPIPNRKALEFRKFKYDLTRIYS